MTKAKTYVALIPLAYAVVAVFVPWIDGGTVPTGADWVQIGIGVLLAFQVHLVPLTMRYPWVKSVVGAGLAGLGALAVALVGGVTAAEGLDIAVYVLAALGIFIAPAESDNGVAVGVGPDSVVSA